MQFGLRLHYLCLERGLESLVLLVDIFLKFRHSLIFFILYHFDQSFILHAVHLT